MGMPAWLTARPIAHRGLHDANQGLIENSPSAARAAIAAGFAIECDVQLTRDGEAVVFHDFDLARLTSARGDLIDFDADMLRTIQLKGASDTIVGLTEFMQLIGGRVPLIIEIKSRFNGDLSLTARTAAVVAAFPDHPVALKSFDPACVAALRDLCPDRPRGVVGMNDYGDHEFARLSIDERHALANLLHYPVSRPDFLSWRVRDLQSGVPFLWRQACRQPLMSWTIRSTVDRAMAAEYADQMVFEGFNP